MRSNPIGDQATESGGQLGRLIASHKKKKKEKSEVIVCGGCNSRPTPHQLARNTSCTVCVVLCAVCVHVCERGRNYSPDSSVSRVSLEVDVDLFLKRLTADGAI